MKIDVIPGSAELVRELELDPHEATRGLILTLADGSSTVLVERADICDSPYLETVKIGQFAYFEHSNETGRAHTAAAYELFDAWARGTIGEEEAAYREQCAAQHRDYIAAGVAEMHREQAGLSARGLLQVADQGLEAYEADRTLGGVVYVYIEGVGVITARDRGATADGGHLVEFGEFAGFMPGKTARLPHPPETWGDAAEQLYNSPNCHGIDPAEITEVGP